MKKLLIVLSLFTVLFGCDKEIADKKGTIVFNNSVVGEAFKTANIDDVDKLAYAVVTIASDDETVVYSQEKIEVFKMDDQILSSPLELLQGSFKLTDFYLVDSSNNILFVAPKEGSVKAQYVQDALPINFTINDTEETKTSVEVLSTKNVNPQEFGYSEFDVSFVETFDILVSLFEYDDASAAFVLTNGTIVVTGTDFSLSDTLIATNNVITLVDSLVSYTVKISRNSSTVYNYTFTMDSIKKHSVEKLKPIKVIINGDSIFVIQPDGAEGKDTRIASYTTDQGAAAATTNYAGAKEFAALEWTFSGNVGDVRGLIDFDLPGFLEGKSVEEAKLYLTAVGNLSFCINDSSHSKLSGSNACYLSQITSQWDENTVTWNTQPTVRVDNRVILPESQNNMQNYVVDVTDFINNELANPNDYFGFMLQLLTEEYYRRLHFGSSDAPDPTTHPKLVIKL